MAPNTTATAAPAPSSTSSGKSVGQPQKQRERQEYTARAILLGSFDKFVQETSATQLYNNQLRGESQRTDDVIPLLDKALHQQQLAHNIEYRLVTDMPHITQKGSEGYNWACGFRNLQMICMSLMTNPLYKPLLFDGTGRVPTVQGLQAYIERAWDAGFDAHGQAEFPHGLIGGEQWIGTTEVCTLLRYFGLRAQIVDIVEADIGVAAFMAQMGSPQKYTQKNYECDLCNKIIPTGQRYKCTVRNDYDVCEECLQIPGQPYELVFVDDDPHPPQLEKATSTSGRTITPSKKYGAFDEWNSDDEGMQILKQQLIEDEKKQLFQEQSMRAKKKPKSPKAKAAEESEASLGLATWLRDYFDHMQQPACTHANNASQRNLMEFLSGSGSLDADADAGADAGCKRSSPVASDADRDEGTSSGHPTVAATSSPGSNLKAAKREASSSSSSGSGSGGVRSNEDIVNSLPPEAIHISKHSQVPDQQSKNFVHPVYFQHMGHSRTVIGYESNPKTKKISLIIFDPVSIGFKLKENLQCNGTWQRQVKRGLHTLNHGAYQVMYVSGIMTAVEREQSKVIVGKHYTEPIGTSVKTAGGGAGQA